MTCKFCIFTDPLPQQEHGYPENLPNLMKSSTFKRERPLSGELQLVVSLLLLLHQSFI